MCQILRMSYDSGSIVIEISSSRDLTDANFELYLFDFLNGCYNSKAHIKQPIKPSNVAQDSGLYRFKYSVPSNCKVKCVITDGEDTIISKERFIGDRYKIKVETENSEIGYIYKMKSDVSISKNLIFYKSPISSTLINLPDNLLAGDTLMFTIKNKDFKPSFKTLPEFAECFNIEG